MQINSYLPRICHVPIAFSKLRVNSKCFFIFCNARVEVVQLKESYNQIKILIHDPELTKKSKNELKGRNKNITKGQPDNKLPPREEGYLCVVGFSHTQICYFLVPAYNYHLCNFDEQGSRACLHQLCKK